MNKKFRVSQVVSGLTLTPEIMTGRDVLARFGAAIWGYVQQSAKNGGLTFELKDGLSVQISPADYDANRY